MAPVGPTAKKSLRDYDIFNLKKFACITDKELALSINISEQSNMQVALGYSGLKQFGKVFIIVC